MTHTVSHFAILAGYLLAMVLVPTALSALIRVHWWTALSGAGFFLFCGLTHVGIALDQYGQTWVAVTDHLQAVAILVFIPSLYRDLMGALGRFQVVLAESPGNLPVGSRVAAALQDKPGWESPVQ